MALPICIEIPEIPDPLAITLPGGVTLQQLNLMEAIQPALTPLIPLFELIDTVVAVFNCVKAIPDSLGPPPDPTVLAACIPELAEKVSKLLRLIPQLSLPYTIIGIIDLVIDTLQQARSQLMHLQQQMQQILGAIDRATELGDAGLMAIISCAQANVAQEAANVGKSLASLGTLLTPSFEDMGPLPGEAAHWTLTATTSLEVLAGFGTVPGEAWEDFERWYTLLATLDDVTVVLAFFDSAAEGYEDFEEAYLERGGAQGAARTGPPSRCGAACGEQRGHEQPPPGPGGFSTHAPPPGSR